MSTSTIGRALGSRRVAAAGMALAVAAGLAACSSAPAADGEASEDAPLKVINVMDTAGTSASFIQYTIENGFFEAEGLDVSLQVAQGGAASIPALMGGDVQVAGAGVSTFVQAIAQGLPLSFVAPGVIASADDPSSTLYVKADSDIQDVTDLAGKSVGVCFVNSLCDLVVMVSLDKEDMTPDQVEFREVPFADTLAAVQDGLVDAGLFIEPFQSFAELAGLRPIAYPYAEVRSPLQISAYVTTQELAQDDPEAVAAFQAALLRTIEAIEADPVEFQKFMLAYSNYPESIADKVTLPTWTAEGDRASWDAWADAMVKFGYIDAKPDFKPFFGR